MEETQVLTKKIKIFLPKFRLLGEALSSKFIIPIQIPGSTRRALSALKPRMLPVESSLTQWSAAEAKSRAMIRELLQAFERQDFVLVSDVLEYEMYNLMEAWLEVIDRCEFS